VPFRRGVEQQEGPGGGGADAARQVYTDAVASVPDVVSLRVALAELEEAQGQRDAAKAVLKAAFDRLPR